MTATAENPLSHKCVVTKGSNTIIALSDKRGWSFFASSQNGGSLFPLNKSFKEQP
jgi:hypothetical protein